MTFNQNIEDRIMNAISDWKDCTAKNMFGGVCHLFRGHMFCGVYKDYLILRLGQPDADSALGLPDVKPFDITGRPMKGWVMVAARAVEKDADLISWLEKARQFAAGLPPK